MNGFVDDVNDAEITIETCEMTIVPKNAVYKMGQKKID